MQEYKPVTVGTYVNGRQSKAVHMRGVVLMQRVKPQSSVALTKNTYLRVHRETYVCMNVCIYVHMYIYMYIIG